MMHYERDLTPNVISSLVNVGYDVIFICICIISYTTFIRRSNTFSLKEPGSKPSEFVILFILYKTCTLNIIFSNKELPRKEKYSTMIKIFIIFYRINNSTFYLYIIESFLSFYMTSSFSS